MEEIVDKKSEKKEESHIEECENGDKKWISEKDWKLYNPEKYHNPNWSPELE